MAPEISPEDMNKALFLNLVMMLGSTTMQQLGRIVNPLTGKTEVDLQGAQASIDMLSMLKAKTEGNLDTDEERMIKDTLSSLQMNFVETSEAEKAKPDAERTEPRAAETAESGDEAAEEEEGEEAAEIEAPVEGEAHKEPKFHKSYGE